MSTPSPRYRSEHLLLARIRWPPSATKAERARMARLRRTFRRHAPIPLPTTGYDLLPLSRHPLLREELGTADVELLAFPAPAVTDLSRPLYDAAVAGWLPHLVEPLTGDPRDLSSVSCDRVLQRLDELGHIMQSGHLQRIHRLVLQMQGDAPRHRHKASRLADHITGALTP